MGKKRLLLGAGTITVGFALVALVRSISSPSPPSSAAPPTDTTTDTTADSAIDSATGGDAPRSPVAPTDHRPSTSRDSLNPPTAAPATAPSIDDAPQPASGSASASTPLAEPTEQMKQRAQKRRSLRSLADRLAKLESLLTRAQESGDSQLVGEIQRRINRLHQRTSVLERELEASRRLSPRERSEPPATP